MNDELKSFWQNGLSELNKAVTDVNHPFRTCVLATVFKEKVNQRTVVHRNFYQNNTSIIYTDSRSKKVLQLESNPISSLLFYDPEKQLQISVAGLMNVHEADEVCMTEFNKLSRHDDYTNNPPPGSLIKQSNHYDKGKAFFIVLKFNWLEVDVLQLSREGHKRSFMRRVDNTWHGNWIVP